MTSNPLDDSAKWLESARRDRQNAIDLAKRYQAENSRLQAEITQLRAELQGVRLGAEGMGWAPRSPVETDSALPQLRRIDRAARAFVDAFDGDAVQDYLEQECAAEWKELNEALFDGRTAQETCGKPFGDDVREYRCTEPAGHSGPCKQSPLKASEPRELTASEAASFSKTLARSPRVLEKAGARPTPQQLGERHADTLRALAEDVCKCRGKLGWTRDESGKAICTDCRLPITHPEKAKPAHTCKHGNDWLACKLCGGAVKTNWPQLAMVPNQHHPGVGCSCRDCLTRYPSDPSEGKLVEYCLCGLIKPAPGVACAWCGTLNGEAKHG